MLTEIWQTVFVAFLIFCFLIVMVSTLNGVAKRKLVQPAGPLMCAIASVFCAVTATILFFCLIV